MLLLLIIVNLFSGTFLLEASKDLIFNTDTVYNTYCMLES